jgi:type V secretory pathway adhesin AidA
VGIVGTNSVTISNQSNSNGGWDEVFSNPVTISNTSYLTLTGTTTPPDPTGFGTYFDIELWDSTGDNSLIYRFNYSSFDNGPKAISAALYADNGFTGNQVTEISLDLFGTGGDSISNVSFTFSSLEASAVPEPSAYALLGMSVISLIGLGFRRVRRQANA